MSGVTTLQGYPSAIAAARLRRLRHEADPAHEAVEAIAAAAGKRDRRRDRAPRADFRGSDGSGRAEAEQTLRRYLAAYESLDVSLKDLSIERAPASARVRFRADLSGSPRNVGGLEGWLPRTSSYRFDLRLVPEGDSWKRVGPRGSR